MSLRGRILRVLILIVTLSVSLSLGVGYYATQQQFNAFVDELSRHKANNLAGRLSQVYTETASWGFIDTALSELGYLYNTESEHQEGGEDKSEADEPELFHLDRIRVIIVDVEGKIIKDNYLELTAGQRSPNINGPRSDILDLQNSQTVGYAYVDVNQDFLETESLGFLHELLVSSTLGGSLTIAFATLLALSLSKRITAPVTALTKATQAIAQRNDATLLPVTSTDELGQMSMAFNQMTSALQRQRDLRKRLISDVSHDLNTPLTVIHLEAKALLDNLQSASQAAGNIIQEVSMLRNLVSDLNWLAETDSGEFQLNLEPCAVEQFLTSEVERWQLQAEAHHISLSHSPLGRLPILQLDRARMHQALGNIIHNALQHVEQGSVVVAASMGIDDFVQISVKDTGVGIAPADLPLIFHRFYRADQSRGSGTGLGLDIARTIIEAHSGTIAVHSEGIGFGTTVTVRLPSKQNIV